jgi:polar amino acid transport system substrate-binding protein
MMKKLLIALSVGMLLLSGCVGDDDKDPDARPVLKVGMELAYPPFETSDLQGNPSGVSVDIAKGFAQYLKYYIEIENTNWSGLIPALQTESVDMVISSMTITEERRESVDFSDPYARALLALIVPIDSTIVDSDELNSEEYTIAVKTASTGDSFATENFPKAEILRFDNESNAIAEVVNKRADAFVYGQLTVLRNVASNPDTTKPLFLSGQQSEGWGAAFPKGSDLVEKFNAFLVDYRTGGGFDLVTEQYLKEEKKLFDSYDFDFFFDFD